jgi:hypothetical protein
MAHSMLCAFDAFPVMDVVVLRSTLRLPDAWLAMMTVRVMAAFVLG